MRAIDTTPADAPGALADFLCFDLYAASRAMTGVYRRVLDPLHLTYPQYLVLTVLWHRGSATVGEIIHDVQLDYGTVSPLLKRLETQGLVERRRRTDDERSVDITLTDAGRALREPAAALPAVITEAFGLDVDEMAELRQLLTRVRASAAGRTAPPDAPARAPAAPPSAARASAAPTAPTAPTATA